MTMELCGSISVRGRDWSLGNPSPVVAPIGVHPLAAAVVASRGVDDLETYFTPTFHNSMPDPNVLPNMEAAVARMAQAIIGGQRIAIVGDYDVDGATTTALLVRLLRDLGHAATSWRIPHRIDDGYGVNEIMIDKIAAEDGKVDLLLLVDNGTAAKDAVAHARAAGADVLILDHHEAQGGLPDAILVNPKHPDCDRSYEYLCSAGVAFLFAVSVVRSLRSSGFFSDGKSEPDTRRYLGLVALATVADVVPLVGLNRAYVARGIGRMGEFAGLRALKVVTDQKSYTAHACGFVFGPCLNAAGRIMDMSVGVELLIEDDESVALPVAKRLHELNQDRRKIQEAAVESAKERLTAEPPGAGIVLYDTEWHPGIVGLVAAKVREAFDRPAIVIGNGGKGSARTVDGFDVGAAIIDAVSGGILLRGGGHAAAAGLTIAPDRVDDLRRHLEGRLVGFEPAATKVDVVLECGTVDPDLARGFEAMAPFGQGNSKPRVAVVGGRVTKVTVFRGLHIKAILEGPSGRTEILAFRSVDTPLGAAIKAAEGGRLDVLGTLEVSTWNGVDTVIVKPEDVISPKTGMLSEVA